MTFASGDRVTAVELNTVSLIPTVPTSTSSNGTVTSGTTETFDAVLGYYQFTAVAGLRYMAICNGLVASSTAAEVYYFRIRDSGTSSNPISSDTEIGRWQWYCPATGGSGQTSLFIQQSFIAATGGTHTLGVSCTRASGSNTCTPLGTRELFVVSIGTV